MSTNKHIGYVTQVIGPVVDVRFDDGNLPDILNAIEINYAGGRLVVEVSGHVGDNVVRCIAMSSTDGLVRCGYRKGNHRSRRRADSRQNFQCAG